MLYRRRLQLMNELRGGFSTSRYMAPVRAPYLFRPVVVRPLQLVEDRRRYHPLGFRAPAATFSRLDQRRLVERLVSPPRAVSASSWTMPAARIGFAVPRKVAVCVRRKMRRQVLFAVGGTGKGSRARRKYNQFSTVVC